MPRPRNTSEVAPRRAVSHSRPATASAVPTPARRPSERRDELLQFAARRFAEFGFETTTIRDIAQDAQILSGSIYHHFETKDAILHELIRDAVAALRDNVVRIAEADCDAEHKMVALILLSMRELINDQFVQAILYNERKLFRRRPEFAYVRDAKGTIYHVWGKILRDGVDAGLFKPGIDTFLTISTTTRLLNTCADWFRHEDDADFATLPHYNYEQVARFNLDFILGAIRHPRRIGDPIPIEIGERLIAP